MEIAALVIALLAAAFTGIQALEARRTRAAAREANRLAKEANSHAATASEAASESNVIAGGALELAQRVDERQIRADERAAVQWQPRMHPKYGWIIEFEHTGHELAHWVRLDPEQLAGVRHRMLHNSWKVEPGAFHKFEVTAEKDLADMPDTVKIWYSLTERQQDVRSRIVSLSRLREEFSERSAKAREREENAAAVRNRVRAEGADRDASSRSVESTPPLPAQQPATPDERPQTGSPTPER